MATQNEIEPAVQQLLASERGTRVLRKFADMLDAGLVGLDSYNRHALSVLIEQTYENPHSVHDSLYRNSIMD